MRLNLRTLLAVAATTLLVLPSVGSIPLDNPDDIALKKRNNALHTDTRVLSKANEAYSIVNLPRAPAVAPKLRPKPEDGSDAPKGPVRPDNPAIGDPKGTKCQRYLQGRCSDAEETDADEMEIDDEDTDKGYPYYFSHGGGRIRAMNAKIDAIRADPSGNHDNPMAAVNDDSYRLTSEPVNTALWSGFSTVQRVFDDLGLDKGNTMMKGYKAYAKKGTEEKIVSENYVSESSAPVIIAKWNNMQSHNIALPPNRIERRSDLTYSALATSRGKLFEDIKFIIREGINNEGTKNVIKKLHAELPNKVQNGKGTFDLVSQNAEEAEAATALIGTPNGSAIYLVIDYPKAFGNQKIVRVHTWDFEQKWAMALELGPM